MNLINPVSFSAAQNYSNRALKSNLKQSSASQINNAINFGSASAQVIKSPVTQKLAASAVAMVAGLAGLAAVSAKDLITKNQTDETANTPNNNTTTNLENASQNKPNNVNAPIEEENNSTKPNSEKEIRITKENLIQELKKPAPSIEEMAEQHNVSCTHVVRNIKTHTNSKVEVEKGSSLEKKLKEERIQREKELAKEAKRIAIMEKADEIQMEKMYWIDLVKVTKYNILMRLLKFFGKKDV